MAMTDAQHQEAIGGWTIDTLKEHLEALMVSQHSGMSNSLKDFERRMDERFSSQLAAIVKAETATEKRLEGMNEFRAQLDDVIATLLPKTEYEVRHKGLVDRTDALRDDLASIKNELVPRVEHEVRYRGFTETTNSLRIDLTTVKADLQKEITAAKDDIRKEIAELRASRDTNTGKSQGIGMFWGILIAVIGTAVLIVQAILMRK